MSSYDFLFLGVPQSFLGFPEEFLEYLRYLIRDDRRYKILGRPALKDLEQLEYLVKPPLYRIWENLGGPVAPLAPPVPAALLMT